MPERSLVIKVTAGKDDPERCNQAFTVAATAVASGVPVSLWLTGESAWFGLPGRAEDFSLPHAAPLADLLAGVLAAGSVTVCTQCAARRDITPEDLISGVRIAGAAHVRGRDHDRRRPGAGLLSRLLGRLLGRCALGRQALAAQLQHQVFLLGVKGRQRARHPGQKEVREAGITDKRRAGQAGPDHPSVPSPLPTPVSTVASGFTSGPRLVRPWWFSKPVSRSTPSAGSTSAVISPTPRRSPRALRMSSRPSPGTGSPSGPPNSA